MSVKQLREFIDRVPIRSSEGENIRIGDLILCEFQVFLNRERQLWQDQRYALGFLKNGWVIPMVEKRTMTFRDVSTIVFKTKVSLLTNQKATKNPNHEKVNTRPYILKGFKAGMDRALRLTGLTTGALQRVVTSYMVDGEGERPG